MAEKRIQTRLEIVGDAKGSLEKIARAADELGDGLDDSRTAAQKVSAALSQVADRAKQELDAAEAAADALGEALGPELAAKMGRNGLLAAVSDFERLGLTMDEVRAEADTLAAGIKDLDGVTSRLDGVTTGNRQIADSFDDVSDRADNTRSVVANFAGNAASELPGVASAMGPLNMAIGQFGEYATEGNIKFKSFIAAGLGLGGMSLILGAIGKHFADIAETKAFRKERVESFIDALRDAESTAEGIKNALADTGKFEFRLQGDTIDAMTYFTRFGYDVNDVVKILQGGQPAIDAFGQKLRDQGVWTYGVSLMTEALEQNLQAYNTATHQAAIEAAFYGDAMEETEGRTKGAKSATIGLGDAVAKAGDKLDDAATDADTFRAAIEKVTGAGRNMDDARQAWEEGVDALTESFKENGATLDISTDKGRANADAIKGQIDTLLQEYIPALVQSGVSNEEAAGHAETLQHALVEQMKQHGFSEEAARAYIEQLGLTPAEIETAINLANTETAKSQVDAWVGKLGEIDAEVPTDVQALINQGMYDEALAKLQELEKERIANLKLYVTAEGSVGVVSNKTSTRRQHGGPIPGAPSDEVPIIAHGGEYVLDAGTVDAIKRGSPSRGAARGVPADGGMPLVSITVQGSIYGEAHLRRMLEDLGRDVAARVAAGSRFP